MARLLGSITALSLFSGGLSLAAQAEEFKRVEDCTPGVKVVHRDGRAGTVIGRGTYSCLVKQTNGEEVYWSFGMTRPAGTHVASINRVHWLDDALLEPACAG